MNARSPVPKSAPALPRPAGNGDIVSFRGRLDRTGYVVRFAAAILAEILIGTACLHAPDMSQSGFGGFFLIVLGCIALGTAAFVLLVFWSIQRLHDIDRVGGWLLLLVIPAAWPFALALFVWPGVRHANRFDVSAAPPPRPGAPHVAGAPAAAPSNAGAWATIVSTSVLGVIASVIGFIVLVCSLLSGLHFR